jgi:predicted 2-oxoglutarate/Fe(II)-dependent dioxygenase YbiX
MSDSAIREPQPALLINAAARARSPIIYPTGELASSDRRPAGIFLDTNDCVASPSVFTGIFSSDECDAIRDLGLRAPQHSGRMLEARYQQISSRVAYLGVGPDTQWLYAKLWHIFNSINRWYAFELRGLVDELQFSTYSVGDGINWHLDTGAGQTSTRKISISVQLTQGTDYSGGDLEFSGFPQLEAARDRGTVILFPAFLAHRIARITRGLRHSLVAWAHGPAFV